jgi:hypothetical protein
MHLQRSRDLGPDIDALALGAGGRVGLDAVLGDLDQRLRRTWAPGLAVRRAWTWSAADRRDPQWWPQGISASPGPERVLAVSWYATSGGSRLSFLDLDSRRYRHVTLVRPDGEGGRLPLKIHAGGIAWHGPWLHLAATRGGFWSCHVDDVVRTEEGYELPVRFRYSSPEKTDDQLRFSFLTVDGEELVAGEYGGAAQSRRLARVALDPETLLPVTDGDDHVVPVVTDHGVVRAQGVARIGGRHYLTASHGPWALGSIWAGEPDDFRERRWAVPMGPEDLAYDADGNWLLTVTEHPRRRWVVAMRPSSFD